MRTAWTGIAELTRRVEVRDSELSLAIVEARELLIRRNIDPCTVAVGRVRPPKLAR